MALQQIFKGIYTLVYGARTKPKIYDYGYCKQQIFPFVNLSLCSFQRVFRSMPLLFTYLSAVKMQNCDGFSCAHTNHWFKWTYKCA